MSEKLSLINSIFSLVVFHNFPTF